jgi:hypothetical protein
MAGREVQVRDVYLRIGVACQGGVGRLGAGGEQRLVVADR